MRNRAEKEASAIFGRPAVQAVIDNPKQAKEAMLKNHGAVLTAIKDLRPLLQDIKAAVSFGQNLPQEVSLGVIFMWLGYGKEIIYHEH